MPVSISRSQFIRVVVAVDPAVTSGEDSDDTGIIVVARGPHQESTCNLEGCPGHGYVLDDLTCKDVPSGWARRAVAAYDKWHANEIVAEVNNGGDMVGETIRAIRQGVAYQAVRATRGKLTRAEPASALYEQGRVHHLGTFTDLEDQLTTWTPTSGESPDRLDALVWGLTALHLIGMVPGPIVLTVEELNHLQFLEAQALGELPKPMPIVFGAIAGDTRMQVDAEDQDDDRPKPNGKTKRSPFA